MTDQDNLPITLPAPLQYLKEMKDKNAIISHLLELYYTDTNNFLNILKEIKGLFVAKRILKKFDIFMFLIQQNGKKVRIHKLNYFLSFLVRKLNTGMKSTKKIKIQTLNIGENDICTLETSSCPELFFCSKKSPQLMPSLVDSGS